MIRRKKQTVTIQQKKFGDTPNRVGGCSACRSDLFLPDVSCRLCGSGRTRYLFAKNGHDLYLCIACRVVFVAMDFSSAERDRFLDSFYSPSYFNPSERSDGEAGAGYSSDYFTSKKEEKLEFAVRMLGRIEHYRPKRGRLLDVGCAAGFFLQAAVERGWQATGVEVSAAAADFATQTLGLEVQTGAFEKSELPPASFDVVTAWDVIEHVANPQEFVRQARRLLKTDGLLFLGTPNVDSLAARLRGKAWKIFKPPEHLFYFNCRSLRQLLQPHFHLVSMQTIQAPPTRIQRSVKKRIKYSAYRVFDAAAALLQRSEYMLVIATVRQGDRTRR